MLTILSDTQVRTLSDSIKTIDEQLATIHTLLATCQTVNFDGTTPAAKSPKAVPQAATETKSQSATPKSRRGRKRSTLSAKQVLDIKRRLAKGDTVTEISRHYKVHFTTIYSIKWGKTWQHVTLQQAAPVTIHA
jgi:hypothetical protein